MNKADDLPEALGSIDELNSLIGVCRYTTSLDEELQRIQKNLLTIGSLLAGSEIQRFKGAETKHLEKLTDKLTKELPKLSNFIYPKGPLHVARAVCRRAERRVVALEIKDKNILKYMNRLSDALFTMGRWTSFKSGVVEEVWKG